MNTACRTAKNKNAFAWRMTLRLPAFVVTSLPVVRCLFRLAEQVVAVLVCAEQPSSASPLMGQ